MWNPAPKSMASVSKFLADGVSRHDDLLASHEHVLDATLWQLTSRVLVRGGECNDSAHLVHGTDEPVEVTVFDLRFEYRHAIAARVAVVELVPGRLARRARLLPGCEQSLAVRAPSVTAHGPPLEALPATRSRVIDAVRLEGVGLPVRGKCADLCIRQFDAWFECHAVPFPSGGSSSEVPVVPVVAGGFR